MTNFSNYSDSDSERDPSALRSALLSGILNEPTQDSDTNKDMEITFVPGLEESVANKLSKKEEKELTPWEKYQQKVEEKKKEKKERKRKRMEGKEEKEGDVKGAVGTLAGGKVLKKKKLEIQEQEKKKADELALLMLNESLSDKPKKGFNLDRLVSEAAAMDEEQMKKKGKKKGKKGKAKAGADAQVLVFFIFIFFL